MPTKISEANSVSPDLHGSGKYRLTEADKEKLRTAAVDDVIPFNDYMRICNDILNDPDHQSLTSLNPSEDRIFIKK